MVTLCNKPYKLSGGALCEATAAELDAGRKKTMAYKILDAHNTSGDDTKFQIKYDAMASHDITYVGIIQTARAAGFDGEFPLPYVLTNCHNSLCAVGGTINEDDHQFGLSAAKRYGGIYVPAHQAVIHSYMREMMSGCGKMILGSDSHTRYGALGTLAVGEGGPELAKQILGRTWDIAAPGVVAIRLTGSPRPGVGPQDVAIAIIGAVYDNGFVANKIMEFIGDGVANLPMEYRCGVDVMTTETKCLSSIWITDSQTERYFINHGRPEAYKKLEPDDGAVYDALVEVDLSKVEPMIALPYHPSIAYTIREFNENARDIIAEKIPAMLDCIDESGRVRAVQGVVAGCAGGTFDNLCAMHDIMKNGTVGPDAFAISAYPASQPVYMELMKNGVAADLLGYGVSLRTAFCGPCFGAGDVPPNKGLSLRHTTRNFPNREGSKPGEGQSAFVCLMDARSIAASAVNGGYVTSACDMDVEYNNYEYKFDDAPYRSRVYMGYGNADNSVELVYGPNITDWPAQPALSDDILLGVASVIRDEVTTTDELIPSGESSSYRSNPVRLSKLTLSRRDPDYVARAEKIKAEAPSAAVIDAVKALGADPAALEIGSVVCSRKPGDGSAREQAASCQRVLGGLANIAYGYATKRYRSNLINWGMLPFVFEEDFMTAEPPFEVGDYILVRGVRAAVGTSESRLDAVIIKPDGTTKPLPLVLPPVTEDEKDIILAGCLINYIGGKK